MSLLSAIEQPQTEREMNSVPHNRLLIVSRDLQIFALHLQSYD
jgi:hypothetical protein